MGASISVNLSQKSFDAASGTSVIHVEVILTSNAGTHNHYTDEDQGAILTVTIGEQSYSGVCPFGSSSSGTFTETVFSSDISVVHSADSTKTFFVNASLYTGTGAGTVSDSASMSLSPAGGSSGGSDSGDDYEGGGSSGGSSGAGQGNAAIVGQCGLYESHDYVQDIAYSPENSATIYSTSIAIVKFIAPSFSGISTSVDAELAISFQNTSAGAADASTRNFKAALCENDDNYNLYFSSPASVPDPYQIAVETGTANTGTVSLSIPTSRIESGHEYYLILWKEVADATTFFSVSPSTNHSINVNYVEGLVHIDSGSGFDSYQVFIDNGTSWDLAIPYNDNGTSWDLCS
jgi:hypothetical protein